MARISIDPTEVKKTPKFLTFRKKMDWQPHHACGVLCAFWGEVASTEANDSGDISDWTPDYLAERIGVSASIDPNRLWDGLVPGYIEVRPNDRFFVKDWIEIAGPYLRQKYHNTDRQRLIDIWASYGRIYGRDQKSSKSITNEEEDVRFPKGNDPTSFSIEKQFAPPDIYKEPPKDLRGEEDVSLVSSWETEEPKETARSAVEILTSKSPKDRREPRADVSILLERVKRHLEELGETFSYGPWGNYLKRLIVEKKIGPQEIDRRFTHWICSTHPFIKTSLNNAGIFFQKWKQLEDGPITANQDGPHGIKPFYEGAATYREEIKY